MTSSTPMDVKQWVALADAKEDARSSEMKKRYGELAGLSEEERLKQITELARAEHEMAEDKLHDFTKSRLLTWIEMDPGQAQTVAHSYDEALKVLPGTLAMRRVGAVQTVARDLHPDEIEKLYNLIPSILREMPRQVVTSLATGAEKKPRPQRRNKKKWFKLWLAS